MSYYRGAAGIILMIDITNKMSLLKLNWFNIITENCSKNSPVIIVGNKIDREYHRQFNEEDVLHIINNSSISDRIINYVEISAKKM